MLFDFDNTLSDHHSAQAEAVPALLVAHGVEPKHAAELVPVFSEVAQPLWRDLEAGKLTLDTLNHERFRRFVDRIDHDGTLDPDLLAAEYLDRLSRAGHLWPGAIELLEGLRGRVEIGLITNGYAEVQRPRLEHFGLTKFFDSITVSSEIGHAKPSREFFDHALELHGSPEPATVLVVGDSLVSDIAGGAAAGCVTCWFNPAGAPTPDAASGGPRIDHVATTLDQVATLALSP